MRKKSKLSAQKPIKEFFLALGIIAIVLAIPFTIITANKDTNRQSHAASQPAVGINVHAGWGSTTDAENIAVIDKMAEAGITWMRIDMGWANIFPDGPNPTGQWYIDKIDRAVNYANSKGIKVLGIWYYTPGWANGGQDPYTCPTDPNTYAASAQWVATYWAGRIHAWEVWNEPDPYQTFWKCTQDQYVDLLKVAYPAFHAGDPNTKVVLGAPTYNHVPWIEGIYSRGGKDYFDIMATHPYQGKADEAPEYPSDGNVWWFSHYPAVKAVMDRYGDGNKETWFTEIGWSSHANTSSTQNWALGVSEQQQADYFVRSIQYAQTNFPNVTNIFWYNARNRTDADIHNNNFGLLYSNLTPKPAYTAIKNFLTTVTPTAPATTAPTATPLPTAPPTAIPTPTRMPTPTTAPKPIVVSLSESGTSRFSPAVVKYTLKTSGSLKVDMLIVAARDQYGRNVDFPVKSNVTLTGTQSFTTQKTFSRGTYSYWVAYQVNGIWYNLTPTKTFTIK